MARGLVRRIEVLSMGDESQIDWVDVICQRFNKEQQERGNKPYSDGWEASEELCWAQACHSAGASDYRFKGSTLLVNMTGYENTKFAQMVEEAA